jgi:four helix bundle protein
MQDHTKLRVWQRAHRLAIDVRSFADTPEVRDIPDLRSQLIRSACSIPANIAEGCGSGSRRQLAKYLQTSIASSSELDNHLMFAGAANFRIQDLANSLLEELRLIRAMLVTLQKRVREQPD